MKIHRLFISKYNRPPAQTQPRGQNQTWPNSTWTGVIVQALISLPHTHCLCLNTQSTSTRRWWLELRNNSYFDLMKYHMSPDPGGRKSLGHQGSLVPFKQPSTSKEGQQPSKCVNRHVENSRQKPSQDPQAKSWLLPSLETQLVCCKDRLSEEKDKKCWQERKSLKRRHKKKTGGWGRRTQIINQPWLHTFFFLKFTGRWVFSLLLTL